MVHVDILHYKTTLASFSSRADMVYLNATVQFPANANELCNDYKNTLIN